MKVNETFLLKQSLYKAFPGITEVEAESLVHKGKINPYPSGTVMCVEGAVEHEFYVILGGRVKVTKKINNETDRVLNYLGQGDFFGEMGLIHDAPRAATVIAETDILVLEVDEIGFNQVLEEVSTISMAMVKEVSRRLRDNDDMAIEDLREKASELAIAYQRLAELDLARREFLTTIAHELRTPLTSANGYMSAIKMGMVGDDDLAQILDIVSANLDRLTMLTNDILFLQEMELILSEFESINLISLLEQVIESERAFAEKIGVSIDLECDLDEVMISGDVASLEKAFKAILNNAIKFSFSDGRVLVSLKKEKGGVVVQILDEGIGVSEEDLPHIFTRFWRREKFENRLFDGVGLGLSIAKQVIAQHGGEINVESEEGQGTKVTVLL